MTTVKTTCPYCGVGCGINASSDGQITGDTEHPANFGRLCSKGTALGETISLEGRLLTPKLQGREVSWDHALTTVANKFRQAIEQHGPDSVAFYVSGQLLTEDYYVANKLMKGFIGSANIDTNSRLCMASSVAGHKRAFGSDTVPGQYEDFEQADLIVLVGSNLAWCHPVLFQRIAAAKKQHPGLKVVVVDPRKTATSKIADLHLAIRPDGDTALFNRLLCAIADRGLVDAAFVAAHVDGYDAALKAATEAGDCGLSEVEIETFVNWWCQTEKVVTLYSQGVNQSAVGTDKVNSILNCHLATGRIGRPGMGPFSMTGQPNAMGGREVGGLANMLACHLDLENADHRHAVKRFWSAPSMPTAPGLKAVDLFKACADGRIKALWIMSTNPVVSLPEADFVADAIRNVPFTVATDIIEHTDTNACVDLLLPATGWGEKSGTVTNSERRISRQRPFLPVPGSARPDWQIIADVGKHMGWKAAFDYRNEAEIFREHAALSGVAVSLGRDFDISGLSDLSDQDYDQLCPVTWPVPRDGTGKSRFFQKGGFFHAGGRARMLAVRPAEGRQDVGPSFVLNTGRVRDHWHTMTRTGRATRLGSHMAEPYLEIHPLDARRVGVKDAELVRVSNTQSNVVLRVLITERVQVGQCFAPMHWTAQTASNGRINTLVAPVTDPVSGQPASKAVNVTVERYDARWYGFGACARPLEPTRPYAAIARCKTGWTVELAGHKYPTDWEAEARDVLGLNEGDASLFVDETTGIARVAVYDGGQLAGAFFAAKAPVAVARSIVVDMIGREVAADSVLAGTQPTHQAPRGAIVCACMDVGTEEIRRAVAEGAATVEQLGACLGAGTNCGSCRPELQELIDAVSKQPIAAE